MRLFDTHAHLDFPGLALDREAVLGRAREAGVQRIVTIGASRGLDSNHRALEIAREYDWIWCSTGIHPHDAAMADESVIATIRDEFASLPEVVGIGETGLDYFYDKAPKAKQQEVFRAFCRIAREVEKPVIIHSRDADDDTVAILREEGMRHGILHCFTGSRDMAHTLVDDLDFYISFSGIVTFKNGAELLEIAAELPEDRILVETDSPYLAPVPFRGKTNEPSYVRHTLAAIAQARGVEAEALADRTFENALSVFGLNGD